MPTYEYQCTKCGKTFELFQSITERPKRTVQAELKNCDCQAPVTRLLGAGGGVLFKGTGFYETDYRSESYKKAAKAEQETTGGAKADSTKTASATEKAPSKKEKRVDAKPKADSGTRAA